MFMLLDALALVPAQTALPMLLQPSLVVPVQALPVPCEALKRLRAQP